jgi:ATP-dependent Lon protease
MKIKKSKKSNVFSGKINNEHGTDEKIENKSHPNSSSGISIFDKKEVKRLLANQSRTSSLSPRLEAMLNEGDWRPFAIVTQELMNSWELMRKKFPNFIDVINHYERILILAQLMSPPIIYVPPILLIGEPGIGKTRFLRELAELLRVDFFQADLASVSAGFVLSGSSTSWAEGKPGLVSDSRRNSNVANPIILLDEIDKASGDARYDPLGCLYPLLEKNTAEIFKDEALQVSMNCSFINWFASANFIEQIPEPIKSRFNIFQIKKPTPEQMKLVTQSVFNDLLNENDWGGKFNRKLSDNVKNKLQLLNPREQKRTLFNACSEAAFRCKNNQIRSRLISLHVNDIVLKNSEPEKRTIGFY